MATKKTSSGSSSGRNKTRKAVLGGMAGAVPLAIIALGTAILPGNKSGAPAEEAVQHGTVAVKCDADVEDYNSCHTDYPTGCSGSGKYDPFLNLAKNQLPRPASDNAPVLDEAAYKTLEQKIPDGLARSNHGDFKDQLAQLGEGQERAVVGYLYYAKETGAESSNCELTGDDNVDYHIGIGFDSDLASRVTAKKLSATDRKALTQTSVIVEMTPQYRAYYETNWTLDELKKVMGKKVKVIGQLIIDNEHNVPSQNCGFRDDAANTCWRASVWELHPVTAFLVCDRQDNACDANSTDWAELGKTSSQSATATAPAAGARSKRKTQPQ